MSEETVSERYEMPEKVCLLTTSNHVEAHCLFVKLRELKRRWGWVKIQYKSIGDDEYAVFASWVWDNDPPQPGPRKSYDAQMDNLRAFAEGFVEGMRA